MKHPAIHLSLLVYVAADTGLPSLRFATIRWVQMQACRLMGGIHVVEMGSVAMTYIRTKLNEGLFRHSNLIRHTQNLNIKDITLAYFREMAKNSDGSFRHFKDRYLKMSCFGCSGTESTSAKSLFGLFYQPWMIDDDCRATDGMNEW
jgi:hypothetical protein